MTSKISSSVLIPALRLALNHFYDPNHLRQSKLCDYLGIPDSADRVAVMRKILHGLIDAMRPDPKSPIDSTPKRLHQLLEYRFIEQSSQKEVAVEMVLSTRQIQRLEAEALRQLAGHLARRHNIEIDWQEEGEESRMVETESAEPQARGSSDIPEMRIEKEIDWLKRSYPLEILHFDEFLPPLLNTLSPLLNVHSIQIDNQTAGSQASLRANSPSLRQALLNLLTVLIPHLDQGKISFQVRVREETVNLLIVAGSFTGPMGVFANENVQVSQQLVEISQGKISWGMAEELPGQVQVEVSLPRDQTPLVFVIDDNADAQLLFERYLENSGFRYQGTRDPAGAFALVEQLQPRIIILDVMLPGQDGWEVLSQLRRTASTETTPVIISTILPQQELAMMLGASDFLRKPFTRQDLLAALQRQIASSASG